MAYEYMMLDVSNLDGKQYWELVDYLKEKNIPLTDVNFKESDVG